MNVLTLDVFQAGVIGLGLNYGAYMTEIFRAGIQSVGHGQAEAADALGMTYAQRMRRVVLPQAIRVIIPPTGNEFIAMMKDTALVSFLGAAVASRGAVPARAARVQLEHPQPARGAARRGRPCTGSLTSVFTFFQARLEKRISKGYVRTEVKAGGGGKRTQYLPVAAGGGHGRRRARWLEMPLPPEEERAVTTDAVVKVENLHKYFGALEVLKGIEMEVNRGEVVVIFGRSGSGKSTLLRCVNFLEDPTFGTIEVAGIRLEGGHRTRHKASRSASSVCTRAWSSSPSTCSRR